MTRPGQKYIGGEFSETDLAPIIQEGRYLDFEFFFPTLIGERKLSYSESGADSISLILKSLDKQALTLWVPYNFCHETIDRVKNKLPNVKMDAFRYRSVTDIQSQNGKYHVVILVHYNVYDAAEVHPLAQYQDRKELVTIEDFTHSPLEIKNTKANFSFASLRKLIPVSISVAYGRAGDQVEAVEESAFLKIKRTAFQIKAMVLQNPLFGSESVYLDLFKLAEQQLQIPSIQPAHHHEVQLFQRIDFKKLMYHRKSNFSWLIENIKPTHVVRRILSGSYMYFICEVANRDEVRAHFFKLGIFPAIHWVGSNDDCLSFHIDHRYGHEDMIRIKRGFDE